MPTTRQLADPPENGPAGDAFYRVPKMIPAGEPGDPIYQRKLDNPTAELTNGRNWLVLYQSADARETPIAVSGMIVLPNEPPATADGYPLITWAHGTVGVAPECAPTRDWPDSDAHHMNAYPQPLLNHFLSLGWAVAMTDYEGLGVTDRRHPFLLGRSEAYGVLDIVRTTRKLFGDQISNRYAIAGHSQGGQAALFAARYAPGRVDGLVGVAAIAPANHLLDVITAGAQSPLFNAGYAFTPLVLAGAIGGNPEIAPDEVLSTSAMAHWPEVDELCRAGLSKGFWGTGIRGNEQFRRNPPGNLLPTYPTKPNEHQGWFSTQLDHMNPDLDIDVPIRISQSGDDERVVAQTTEIDIPFYGTITVRGTDELVRELRDTNEDSSPELLYRRYPADDNDTGDRVIVPDPDLTGLGFHFATINHDLPAITAWLSDLFNGGG